MTESRPTTEEKAENTCLLPIYSPGSCSLAVGLGLLTSFPEFMRTELRRRGGGGGGGEHKVYVCMSNQCSQSTAHPHDTRTTPQADGRTPLRNNTYVFLLQLQERTYG